MIRSRIGLFLQAVILLSFIDFFESMPLKLIPNLSTRYLLLPRNLQTQLISI